PFDPVSKRTEAEVEAGGKHFRVAKGAPQVISALCGTASDPAVTAAVDRLAMKGYRTLAVARQDNGAWRFIGLVPLFDPPREDSAATLREAQQMGVGIKMVTGDHEAIAREISGQIGLGQNILVAENVFDDDGKRNRLPAILAADGFARVFPEHKFEIVKTLQDAGHIVGMTGDGVNDAPA
ncbi:MAG TPA: metal-transporting ATPase, partial [Rhodobiaceae bacterium]|nr:metal-transporting ATPase [Rhodobiaceae bacterium]